MRSPNYFIYNDVDSRNMGVHVVSYPPMMRAQERVKTITVPGRAGSLTIREGEKIYDPYTRTMTVSNALGADIHKVLAWLSGSGTIIFGNEPDYQYEVEMTAQLQMDKVFRKLWSGDLQMYTQPFKMKAGMTTPIAAETSGTVVYNPGDVPAYPSLSVHGASGTVTITVGGKTLTVYSAPNFFRIDTQNQWLIDVNNTRMLNTASGDFGSIPPGKSQITWTGTLTRISVNPRWRYL